MRIQPETDGAGIVLIGSFNPRIFRPEWFNANQIIGSKEAQAAQIQIIHEALSVFSLDWGKISVDPNRLAIETRLSPHIRIQDVLLKTFREFLPHTPIYQMGINRIVHFSVGDITIRDKIGKLLAPHDVWGEWGLKLPGSATDMRLHGGMRSLTMSQLNRDDGLSGSISARVEPSTRPALMLNGIFMEVNDHYIVGQPDEILGSDAAMATLEEQWVKSMERSESIVDQIMALKDRVK